MGHPTETSTQTGWGSSAGECGGDALGADLGLAGTLDHQRLGERRHPKLLELPTDIDQFGRQLARARGVDDVGVPALQRQDLGHATSVALAPSGEVAEPIDDRPDVALDVVEAVDPGAEHEARMHEPAEVEIGVVDRRAQCGSVQLRQPIAGFRCDQDHPSRPVERVRGEARRRVADRPPQRLEVGFGPGQRSVVGHHAIDGGRHTVAAHLTEVDIAGGDREPVGVVDLANDRRPRRRAVQ